MEPDASRRNSWIACPKCGHRAARVRICDAEFKCKYCGCEFEVIIGIIPPSNPQGRLSSDRTPPDAPL